MPQDVTLNLKLPAKSAEMDGRVYSLCEAVADLMEQWAAKSTTFHPNDSREIIHLSIEWARVFENRHKDTEWDGEYYEKIEEFFKEQYECWLQHAKHAQLNPYWVK